MRWKNLFIAAVAAIVVLIAAFYVFVSLYDFNRFKPIIAQAVMDATGRELKIEGDIDLELGIPPTLSAEGIKFQNASWGSRPELAKIARIDLQMALWPLIRGHFEFIRVSLSELDIIVEINDQGKSNVEFETPQGEDELVLPVLIFNDLKIENGMFTYRDSASDHIYTLNLKRLDAVIPGLGNPVQLDLEGAVENTAFTMDGMIGPIMAWFDPGQSWLADLTANVGGAVIHLNGEIHDPINFRKLHYTLTVSGSSTAAIARLAGQDDMPDLGPFKLTAEVTDPDGKLGARKLDFRLGSGDPIEVMLNGTIRDLLSQKGIDLNVVIKGSDVSKLTKLGLPPLPARGAFHVSAQVTDTAANIFSIQNLEAAMGENVFAGEMELNLADTPSYLTAKLKAENFFLKRFNLAGKLTGLTDKLALEKLNLNIGTREILEANLSGEVKNLLDLENIHLSFRMQGKNLANLEKIIGQPMPVRGPFSAVGKVNIPDRKHFQIPALTIICAKNKISGSLGFDLSGKKPKLSAKLASNRFNLTSLLSPEIAKQTWIKVFPDNGPLKLDIQLSGFREELSAEKVDLEAGIEKLAKLKLNGAIEDLNALRGLKLKFAVQGKDAYDFSKHLGQPLPIKGKFAVSGDLADPAEKIYKISSLKFILGQNVLSGWADVDLTHPQPTISVGLSTPKFNLKPLSLTNADALAGIQKMANLGKLNLKVNKARLSDKLSVEHLDIHFGKKDLVDVQLNGAVKDLYTAKGLNLNLNIQGQDVSKLARLLDYSLPVRGAYVISGHITDPKGGIYRLGDLNMTLGKTQFTGWLDLNRTGKIPRLTTELSSPRLNLQWLSIPAITSLTNISDLGPLKVATTIFHSNSKLVVENLDLSTGNELIVDVKLNGRIENLLTPQGFQLNFTAKGKDITNLKTIGVPELPLKGTFNISGQLVDLAPNVFRISNLNTTLGENDGKGWIEVNLTGNRPRVKAELSSEKIDLRPILVKSEKRVDSGNRIAKSDKQKDSVFSNQPWALDTLKVIDADIKIRDKRALFPHFALDELKVDILLENGNLALEPVEFKIGTGLAKGRFLLDSRQASPNIQADMDIGKFDLGRMLDRLGYERASEGNLDVDATLSGTGDSPAALMAGLNGAIYLSMVDGKTESKYLDLLQKYLGTNVVRLLNPFKTQKTYTEINCMFNSIEINDGLADIKVLLDTDQTTIVGAGEIDLKTEKLDLGIKPAPKKGFGYGSVGTISFSLSEFSKPFRLGGTIANPSLQLDPGRTALTLGKLAGAFALGPAGLAVFFSDVSLGKKDPCLHAAETFEKDKETAKTKKTEKNK